MVKHYIRDMNFTETIYLFKLVREKKMLRVMCVRDRKGLYRGRCYYIKSFWIAKNVQKKKYLA